MGDSRHEWGKYNAGYGDHAVRLESHKYVHLMNENITYNCLRQSYNRL